MLVHNVVFKETLDQVELMVPNMLLVRIIENNFIYAYFRLGIFK